MVTPSYFHETWWKCCTYHGQNEHLQKSKFIPMYGFWVMASWSLPQILLFSYSELQKCIFFLTLKLRFILITGNEFKAENWSVTFFLATELESGLKKIISRLFFKLFGLKVGTLFNRKFCKCFFRRLGLPCAPAKGSHESQISDASSTVHDCQQNQNKPTKPAIEEWLPCKVGSG